MNEDPEGISRRENAKDDSPSENQRREAPVVNHRAERGDDPEGISRRESAKGDSPRENVKDNSPSENRRAKRGGDRRTEGPLVNAKRNSAGENRRTEGPLVNARAEAQARTAEQSEVVNAKHNRASENKQAEGLVVRWEELLARAGCDRGVIAHARAVTAVATTFCDSPVVDRDLVRAGAMIHDMGRGTTHGIDHAQRGAALARSLGLNPAIVAIIERHIGAGLTADECSLEGLVPRDCRPVTAEEKIVANADNLVHGATPGSIEGTLASALHLKKRIRRRILRLYFEMEAFR
jgi:uncharacterized protein